MRPPLLFGLFLFTHGCSSSESGSVTAEVPDTGSTVTDAPTAEASAPKPGPPLGGTTGEPCKEDVDCKAEGFGARCSAKLLASGAAWPSPVCLVPASGASVCALGDGSAVPLCDGDRGLCVRNVAGVNDCMPACRFARDGAPLRACTGANACHVQWIDPTGTMHGYCWGGCTRDADCPSGNACDAATSLCMRTCKTDAECGDSSLRCTGGACRTSAGGALGAACTSGEECNCLVGKSGAGVCIHVCRTGATSCGEGWACDPLLGTPGGPAKGLVATPSGLAGVCLRTCTADGDCGGGACLKSPGMSVSTCRPR